MHCHSSYFCWKLTNTQCWFQSLSVNWGGKKCLKFCPMALVSDVRGYSPFPKPKGCHHFFFWRWEVRHFLLPLLSPHLPPFSHFAATTSPPTPSLGICSSSGRLCLPFYQLRLTKRQLQKNREKYSGEVKAAALISTAFFASQSLFPACAYILFRDPLNAAQQQDWSVGPPLL